MAKIAQLMLEYNPQPPFNAGSPTTAEKDVVESLLKFGQPLIDTFWTQTKEIAAKKMS